MREDPARQLHLAIESIARGSTPKIQKGRTCALGLLARGANPNSLVAGMTPLARLMRKMTAAEHETLIRGLSDRAKDGIATARHNARFELATALLEAGADPWAGEPNAWDIPRMEGGLYLLMILAERERAGHPVRGSNGDTPMHAILRRPDHELSLYSGLWSAPRPNLHADWIQARNHQGQLPAHVLWESFAQRDQHQGDITVRDALSITQELIGAQALGDGQWKRGMERLPQGFEHVAKTMAQSDQEGMSVAQLMVSCERVRDEILAHDAQEGTCWMPAIELALLEGTTAPVSKVDRQRATRL